jgi:ribosome-associated toxin RatA of RatAB toxin-antitoxin module
MSRYLVSRTAVVAAPASRIFDLLSDPRRHPEFDGSGTVNGIIDGPERLGRGDRFGADMAMSGARYQTRNTVVEYDKNRLLAWKHVGPHRWRWELEDLGDGSTRVTETFDYRRGGPLWRLFYVLSGAPQRNARGIEATLPRLKSLAEDA